MDKNIVHLEGVIGDDFKFGKTEDAKDFCTFSLCISSYSKQYADESERNHQTTYIRIMVFDKKRVEYLKNVEAKRGQRATIFGRISSHKSEYKGIEFIQNNVVVRDISIIKTK